MRTKKLIFYTFGFFLCVLPLISCEEEEDGKIAYTVEPKTEVGAKLAEHTGLIATIFSDSTYSLAEGVDATEMFYFSMKGYAMHVFIFEVDLSNPAISVEVVKPTAPTNPLGLQTVRDQAIHEDADGHRVLGAVNGSFFNVSTGASQGLFYNNGTLLGLPSTAYPNFFVITEDKKALIGSDAIYNSIKDDIYEGIGGGVMLVSNGVLVTQTEAVPSVNPRTCVGVSEDQTKVYIMAVDGRKYHYSNGMTYEELGKFMIALGAESALNLDGGGSTSFLTRKTSEAVPDPFDLRNWPSDNGGEERAISNSLVIVSQ